MQFVALDTSMVEYFMPPTISFEDFVVELEEAIEQGSLTVEEATELLNAYCE